jgi:DMSO/TMAO reductase YedYZ molybdopterin-dependent catalytic subunit
MADDPQQRSGPTEPDEAERAPIHAEKEGEPVQRTVRFTRKWFLAALGGMAAVALGVQRLVSGPGEESTAGGSSGGGAGRLTDDFPVRTVDQAPEAPLQDWVIAVDGLVDRPLQVDSATWSSLPHFEETVDFHCVEGWTVPDVTWGGVHPLRLIELAEPQARATHAVFHAFDGSYTDALSLEQLRAPKNILADSLDGRRVPAEHGGPVRLIIPSQLAYKSVKFVRRVELTDDPERGYWEQRGYPVDAPIPG